MSKKSIWIPLTVIICVLACILGPLGCSTDKARSMVNTPVETTTETITTTETETTAPPETTVPETTAPPETTVPETIAPPETTVSRAYEADVVETAAVYTYVLNTNTKKIHIVDCRSVSQMKESNKKYVEGTLDEILEWYPGYTVCGNCHARY